MHLYYDYDYCCEELEAFGRGLRDKINGVMPAALTDIGMMKILLDVVVPTGDSMECPFCYVSIEETYKKMKDQWTARYLGGAVLHPPEEG